MSNGYTGENGLSCPCPIYRIRKTRKIDIAKLHVGRAFCQSAALLLFIISVLWPTGGRGAVLFKDFKMELSIHSFIIRTSKFKFRLTVLNFFENLRLDCS